ncbi:sialidase family protein [Roseivirga sp. E12]|uniref:WD40/YVTN/BNR-like repeat-containing protein n=1 Tax=Roseivirga sp. E12 TaxID=2819237 RepID=UPI001ABD03EF|nr:sialidase family protein [Roseivirga sp. E12]MBO3698092.1 glycosyl hydrolase [Roseivirga sp. E12]
MLSLRKSAALLLSILCLFSLSNLSAQSVDAAALQRAANGLKLRNIGPAVMGGRIADIAVNPHNKSNWYVAVGSGGVWKTDNSGITWKPVFDNQASYSIGTVSIDPNTPSTVWVGTGENVSGRHVGWGDGVYKSTNAGATWQRMGLAKSEHIGKILIDPRNSDVVLVAAEGPLWSAGGERGLYRSTDGGKTWTATLQIDENTGVTDIEFDPSNPDVIYAAAYQRRRKTWSLLAGGPKSGIYKSTDNGSTWKKITTGLPRADMGKIGLAVTPANPDLVYATIESDNRNKGFYKSTNKGESWAKQNSYTSGGTGPHYYQEIEASPQNPDLIYQMDVFIRVTRNAGKDFNVLGTGREKHSDNHALWIDPDNGNHLIAGTDAGLYETFDEGTTWRHFPNMPVAQFYKIALDNAEPFYNIVAGAQDLGTLIGPSRTTNTEGVRNQDWYIPLGADGYDAAFDPEDPNIVYMEIQGGELNRLDRRTEEVIKIKPSPAPGDAPERFNWDAPIIVSPHDSKTIYFGSQRVWKSEDRGDSWTVISQDLTTNTNRYTLEMMDKVPSVDALYDNGAMSKYATLTGISESPVAKGLLYTGSDDGLIHVSEDDGQSWKKAGSLPKVPERSFINDIEASQHDANTVFAIADAHKLGDYNTYLFMSANKGRSWQSIAGDLPQGTIVWSIKQDHVDKNLLFLGAEYGIYFSPNMGKNWIKMAGVPTIPFRDVELHPRDNDLVGGTFGRGIYVLDDYSPLRGISQAMQAKSNTVFPIRDAWWYIPNAPMQAAGMPTAGSTSYKSKNPDFGAIITYYLHDMPKTSRSERLTAEKAMSDKGESIPFPGWDKLAEESKEDSPSSMLLVRDASGASVRWIQGASGKGLHRTTWDLRLPASNPINLSQPGFRPPWAGTPQGPLVAPGKYSVELFVLNNGSLESQGAPQEFMVKAAPNASSGADYQAVAAFQRRGNVLSRQMSNTNSRLGEAAQKLRFIRAALPKTPRVTPAMFETLKALNSSLADLRKSLNGDPIPSSKNESTSPSIRSRMGTAIGGHGATTQLPTETQKRDLGIAEEGFTQFLKEAENFFAALTAYEAELEKAGAPFTPGRKK